MKKKFILLLLAITVTMCIQHNFNVSGNSIIYLFILTSSYCIFKRSINNLDNYNFNNFLYICINRNNMQKYKYGLYIRQCIK